MFAGTFEANPPVYSPQPGYPLDTPFVNHNQPYVYEGGDTGLGLGGLLSTGLR